MTTEVIRYKIPSAEAEAFVETARKQSVRSRQAHRKEARTRVA